MFGDRGQELREPLLGRQERQVSYLAETQSYAEELAAFTFSAHLFCVLNRIYINVSQKTMEKFFAEWVKANPDLQEKIALSMGLSASSMHVLLSLYPIMRQVFPNASKFISEQGDFHSQQAIDSRESIKDAVTKEEMFLIVLLSAAAMNLALDEGKELEATSMVFAALGTSLDILLKKRLLDSERGSSKDGAYTMLITYVILTSLVFNLALDASLSSNGEFTIFDSSNAQYLLGAAASMVFNYGLYSRFIIPQGEQLQQEEQDQRDIPHRSCRDLTVPVLLKVGGGLYLGYFLYLRILAGLTGDDSVFSNEDSSFILDFEALDLYIRYTILYGGGYAILIYFNSLVAGVIRECYNQEHAPGALDQELDTIRIERLGPDGSQQQFIFGLAAAAVERQVQGVPYSPPREVQFSQNITNYQHPSSLFSLPQDPELSEEAQKRSEKEKQSQSNSEGFYSLSKEEVERLVLQLRSNFASAKNEQAKKTISTMFSQQSPRDETEAAKKEISLLFS